MGLTAVTGGLGARLAGSLARFAAGGPHLLLVAAPGATAQRLAVERMARERAWPVTTTPAEADLLVVCAPDPPPPGIAAATTRLWGQMPGPRARADLHPGAGANTADTADTADSVDTVLTEAARRLGDLAAQRADAASRTPPAGWAAGHQPSSHQPSGGHDGGHDSGHDGGHDSGHDGGHDSGHDGGHDGMGMPAGLPMAERGPDRDGLTLDRLHLPLGPVLPGWPPGLVLHTVVQGDLVQETRVEVAGPAATRRFWDEPWLRALAGAQVTHGEAARRRAAAHLDSLARFLVVAGWDGAALAARRLRDDTLAAGDDPALPQAFDRFSRRITRSRLLRWMTRGLGTLPPARAQALGVGGPAHRAGGDVWDRARQWTRETARDLAALGSTQPLDGDEAAEGPRGRLDGPQPPSEPLLRALPQLLTGAELAGARLIVASLDPDLDQPVGDLNQSPPAEEPARG